MLLEIVRENPACEIYKKSTWKFCPLFAVSLPECWYTSHLVLRALWLAFEWRQSPPRSTPSQHWQLDLSLWSWPLDLDRDLDLSINNTMFSQIVYSCVGWGRLTSSDSCCRSKLVVRGLKHQPRRLRRLAIDQWTSNDYLDFGRLTTDNDRLVEEGGVSVDHPDLWSVGWSWNGSGRPGKGRLICGDESCSILNVGRSEHSCLLESKSIKNCELIAWIKTISNLFTCAKFSSLPSEQESLKFIF